MNNRVIILSGLILMLAVALNYLLEQNSDESSPTVQLRNDPDLYMLNASIAQFNNKGQLQHKIDAIRFTHFPLTDVTSLKQPHLQLFSNSGNPPWKISSNSGRLLPDSDYREEIVELWDDVTATQISSDGGFINIQAKTLTVYPEREYAETNQKVVIDDQTGQTTAAGMKAFFEPGKFIFYSIPTVRVHTTLRPTLNPKLPAQNSLK